MSEKKWESVGRVQLASRRIRRTSPKGPVLVKVVFWLPNFQAPYEFGSYLRYETPDHVYKIYNPLRIAFDVNFLVSYLRTFHKRVDEEILHWEIVSE